MARVTGLEPATSGVTGRHSNQLSYTRAFDEHVSAVFVVGAVDKGFARGCQACEDTINANMRRFFDRHRFVRKTDVKSVDEACIWPCGARSNCLKVRASGRLAQLVERFVYTEDVGGSSPSSPTMISNTYIAFAHGRPAATAAKSGLGEQGLHLQQRRHGWRGAGPRDGNAGDRASEADSL